MATSVSVMSVPHIFKSVPRNRTYSDTVVDGNDLGALLAAVEISRYTGSLTVNFNKGYVSGSVTFRREITAIDPPVNPLTENKS